jgi:hypothetical protein
MKVLCGFLLTVPFLLWIIFRTVAAVSFSIDCGGHIKRAADANTVELAVQEMTTVVNYCEDHKLTSGIVSIFLKQPKNDVGFWYSNLKSSQKELQKLDTNTSQLEKTNVLMKLRETLVDHGESVTITAPEGITIYPHNVAYFMWATVGFVLGVLGCVLIMRGFVDW